jgi:transposase
LRWLLCRDDRSARLAARHLFSFAVDWLLRGIDSERGIAWRAADSLALRDFLGVGLDSGAPDHSTISRTRRLIDLETHRAVFTWVLQCLSTAGLVKGKTIGIDQGVPRA